jgi:diguanylate cyclase (GGDEF)-like protein
MDHFAFLLPVIFCAFGLIFLLVARHEPLAAPFWGAGYLLAAVAFCMSALPDVVPVEAQAFAADTLFLLALTAYGHALLRQFGRTMPVWPRAGLIAFGVLASALSIFVFQSPAMGFAANDLLSSLCLAIPGLAVVRHVRRGIDRALVGLAFAVAGDAVLRTLVMTAMNRNPASFENFLTTSYAFLMQATGTVLGVLMALAALASVTLDVIGRYRDVAERDPLTGLLNRRGFETRIGHAFAQAPKRAGGSIIVCDIDHFKRVNDRFGHATGDAVLVRVAGLIAPIEHPGAALARFGGEEFVLFLPQVALPQAREIAERLHARVMDARWPETAGVPVTASFGVTETRPVDLSIHEAVARADRALYRAKSAGRNRVMVDGAPETDAEASTVLSAA